MTFRLRQSPPAVGPDEDDGFAATVAEDPPSDLVPPGGPAPGRAPLESLPTIGHVGRYALKYRLGAGGLGTVYAALDPLLSRPVAVKTLHVDIEGNAAEALLHEARAAAALSHPHIVTTYDAGVNDDGVYLAMEKLEGRDLRHLLACGWRPQVRQAALIVRRVAEALAYAHGKGIVHCDIKPANIFMVGRTSPKVLDFGIARMAQRPGSDTQALAGGSPYYMAPEQLRGEPVDRRCDVYSLGAVLYELLTGRRAHRGSALDEIVDSVLHRVPAPAHEVNPTIPPALSAIVARAMAKDVEERHRSARQLARELRTWLGEEIPRKRRHRSRPQPKVLAVATGFAVLAVVGAGWALWGHAPLPVTPASAPDALQAPAAPAAPPMVLTSPAPGETPTPSEPPSGPGAVRPAAPDTAPGPSTPARRTASAPERRTPPAVPSPVAAKPPAEGVLRIAVSPWGQVEVNGRPAGTAPPLNRLELPAGRHSIVIRNADFPPYATTVNVSADEPVTVRHRFGP